MVMVDKDLLKATHIGTSCYRLCMVSSASDNLCSLYFKRATRILGMNYRIIGGTDIVCQLYAEADVQETYGPRIPCYFEPGADGVYRGLVTVNLLLLMTKDNMLSSVVSSYLSEKKNELIYFTGAVASLKREALCMVWELLRICRRLMNCIERHSGSMCILWRSGREY